MISKSKSAAILCVITVIAAGLVLLSVFGIGSGKILSAGNIKQGLDLKGGVSAIFQAGKANPTQAEMSAANAMLRERLDRQGYTEAPVSQVGDNRFQVDIPDVTDAETAINAIGRTAMVTFCAPNPDGGPGEVLFDGSHIIDVRSNSVADQSGAVLNIIELKFDEYATDIFADATAEYINQPIYIMMDNETLSSPVVRTEILTGECSIEGMFTPQEASETAALIRAGSLPFSLEVLRLDNVGAQLGSDALRTSMIAGAIGLGLVLVFMFIIYRFAGLAANLALVVYVGLMLVILSAFGITLTLPGIAGIVLSIGMAVDANVIIFERLKEELGDNNRSFRSALQMAFKRAFSAILDGNVTTMISAAILGWLGSGPVQGFAVTLALGIVLSMFTSLAVTRWILKSFMGLGINKASQYNVKPGQKTVTTELKVAANRKTHFIIPSVIVLAAAIFIAVNGGMGNGMFNYSVEFAGGTSLEADLKTADFDRADVEKIILDVTGQGVTVQELIGTNKITAKMRSLTTDETAALKSALKAEYPDINEDTDINTVSVSATVSGEMQRTAVLAVVVALAAMFLYIAVRFHDMRIGGSTIISLVVNSLIVFACYAIFRIQLNETFIVVVLTILGYTVNSTIVMFDRLRENKKIMSGADSSALIDTSASQSLKRSLYTSLTTLFTIVTMLILGVQSIREFSLPIMIGVLFGTYSSLWFAGSVWYSWVNKTSKA